MGKYTKRQILILVTFAIADFCSAVCVSLQAPFYPEEAERKGASATEYGFVFGVFELTVFLASPFYGRFLTAIGPSFLFSAGIFTTGTTCILFGLLDKVFLTSAFVGLSFAIRIVEALGNAAFLTASFSLIAREFPQSVGATFAALETCFGIGLIVGPTLGGGLYEIGGYSLPFLALGSVLVIAAFGTRFVLPPDDSTPVPLIRNPRIYLNSFGSFAYALSFLFVGPAPFFPLEPTLPIVIGALLCHGVGFGAELVATFGGTQREAIKRGFPDNLDTYGLISGIWTSTFALGAFIGPTLAGYLLDTIGFRNATMVVVALHVFVFLFLMFYECCETKSQKYYDILHEENETKKLFANQTLSYGSNDDSCYNSGFESSGSGDEFPSSEKSTFSSSSLNALEANLASNRTLTVFYEEKWWCLRPLETIPEEVVELKE
ncbi:MFS-type transporter SLC18B1 [Armadillidium vulgare]|nr:MFS-type transporter SLC18B1 [Armadillidium vulgare]